MQSAEYGEPATRDAFFAHSPKRGNGQDRDGRLGKVALDDVFIPFEANARRIGDVQQSVLQGVGILENGIGPVLPLKPMRRLRDTHHVRTDFGIEVSRGILVGVGNLLPVDHTTLCTAVTKIDTLWIMLGAAVISLSARWQHAPHRSQ
jgi:hypothetical protein